MACKRIQGWQRQKKCGCYASPIAQFRKVVAQQARVENFIVGIRQQPSKQRLTSLRRVGTIRLRAGYRWMRHLASGCQTTAACLRYEAAAIVGSSSVAG